MAINRRYGAIVKFEMGVYHVHISDGYVDNKGWNVIAKYRPLNDLEIAEYNDQIGQHDLYKYLDEEVMALMDTKLGKILY